MTQIPVQLFEKLTVQENLTGDEPTKKHEEEETASQRQPTDDPSERRHSRMESGSLKTKPEEHKVPLKLCQKKDSCTYGKVRTRHINQLFIRGENVILVNLQPLWCLISVTWKQQEMCATNTTFCALCCKPVRLTVKNVISYWYWYFSLSIREFFSPTLRTKHFSDVTTAIFDLAYTGSASPAVFAFCLLASRWQQKPVSVMCGAIVVKEPVPLCCFPPLVWTGMTGRSLRTS